MTRIESFLLQGIKENEPFYINGEKTAYGPYVYVRGEIFANGGRLILDSEIQSMIKNGVRKAND